MALSITSRRKKLPGSMAHAATNPGVSRHLVVSRSANCLGLRLGQHISMPPPFRHALCCAAHPNGASQHQPTKQPVTHRQSLLTVGDADGLLTVLPPEASHLSTPGSRGLHAPECCARRRSHRSQASVRAAISWTSRVLGRVRRGAAGRGRRSRRIPAHRAVLRAESMKSPSDQLSCPFSPDTRQARPATRRGRYPPRG
jgi:hypothetical protein